MEQKHVDTIFLILLLAISTGLAYSITAPFLSSLFLSAVFAAVTYQYYRKILVKMRGREGLASFLTSLLVGSIVIVPIFIIISVLSGKGLILIEQVVTDGTPEHTFVENTASKVAGWIPDGKKYVEQPDLLLSKFGVANLAQFGAAFFRAAYSGLLEIIFGTVVVLFALFYFYLKGEAILERLQKISFFDNAHDEKLYNEFAAMARGLVKGTVLIGFGQGALGGLVLYVAGVENVLFLTLCMIILAILPIGIWIVMIPAGIFMTDSFWWTGAFVISLGAIIGTVDQFIRPKIIGNDVQMSNGIILMSMIGGMQVWGPIGFIEGPIVWALCIAMWDIFIIEFCNNKCETELDAELVCEEETHS